MAGLTRSMLSTDSRKKKGLTGGSASAAQGSDVDGGLGFTNTNAFMTDSAIAKRDAPSYEEAHNVTGGSSGLAGYDTRMTESEKEEYRTTKMGIAPTKTDDYSEWGIQRKVQADEAHAQGKKSEQDKKDQLVIDSRDSSRYDWDVTRPANAAAAKIASDRAETKGYMDKYTAKPSAPHSPDRGFYNVGGAMRSKKRSSTGDRARVSGRKSTTSNRFADKKVYGSPTEQRTATLTADGWTPAQVEEYGGTLIPFEAQRVQAALPGVQGLSLAESAAQYGGSGKADANSRQLISNNITNPSVRTDMYGQGHRATKGAMHQVS